MSSEPSRLEHEHPNAIHLKFPEELIVIPLSATAVGFIAGFLKGSQLSSLQFLAENAHRQPTTVQGWYFYQKTKNYRIIFGGLKSGLRTGSILGLWTAGFVGVEELYKRVLKRWSGNLVPNRIGQGVDISYAEGGRQRMKMGWVSGGLAGITVALVAGRMYRLPSSSSLRRLLLGASLGSLTGGLQDTRIWLKKRIEAEKAAKEEGQTMLS